MIEPVMYFGIGFLVAALLGLLFVPLVHNRAVRLTMRRLEAATPLSIAEIRAGIGLRLGANLGYLKFTAHPTWNPF